MEDTQSERFKEFSGEYFKRLVEGVAGAYGNKPADAVDLSPDDELERWLQPTSPAALRALELGGSMEAAHEANTLWAHAMRGEQIKITQQMQQAGAAPEQIAQALSQQGLTDDQITLTCRKYAHQLGKQNGHNNPAEEVAYHKRMSERAAKRRMPSIVPMGQEGG